jgi:NADP-dependent 3-hydroxy acid dehydrogenase YdfG
MSELAGRLVVITGGSRGIGLAAAERFAVAGARVVRMARSLSPGSDRRFEDVVADLADPDAVARAAERILTGVGTPDILVNNAGVFDRIPFEQTTVAELTAQLQVNLVGAFAVTRAFVPAMRNAGRGLVITLGSIADLNAYPENSIYSATKFGLRGLHEVLSAEYRGTGVRFTLLSPGPTDTPIWDTVTRGQPVRPRSEMLAASDVAEAMLFIATRPAHVTVDVLRMTPAGSEK